MPIKLTADERFWSKVDPCRTDGCALWLANTGSKGYGFFWLNGKMTLAHHFLKGKPPIGLEWDHGCRRRGCIWPDHLEAVTHKVNMERGVAAASLRTQCPSGHPYDAKNTAVHKAGYRRCRECDRAASLARWRAKHPGSRVYQPRQSPSTSDQ